ncbi:MAG: putative nucleotidyltransferase substrate binding domain-containing protein [Propionibacteriaceae bacterium]
MTAVETTDLAAFLARHPPFDTLDTYGVGTIAAAAEVVGYAAGDVILDAFGAPTAEVVVVLDGPVDLWEHADRITGPAEERLGEGDLFGFSSMLTERPMGPLARAVGPVTVARLPGTVVLPAFASPRGARFLAHEVSAAIGRMHLDPSYAVVEELIESVPLVVHPADPVGEVAQTMTERGRSCAAVALGDGRFGLLTDRVLRTRVLVPGRPLTTPVREVMQTDTPVARLGDSAAEALISMLDHDADHVLVTDPAGRLHGVVEPRDFAVSSTTAGVSVHEQLRRAADADELVDRAHRVPATLADLITRGLSATKVIAVYAAMRDTTIRRAITLVFDIHPELDVDAFTWLSLGSNGRREAVLSSDLDSAAAFDDAITPGQAAAYRAAFGEVNDLLAAAGLSSDEHGASTQRQPFARTNADWRAAARAWLAEPTKNQGAMMTSLLVDGRPIHGDPGLPAVSKVFSDLRQHPGTMRLLLQESLSKRARMRSVRDVLARRPDTFDIKTHALLPIVNIARWAALSVGSAVLPTTERLRVSAGSAMLPTEQAATLVEVFDVLQRLRLHQQIETLHAGDTPSDVLRMDRLSPLERSVIAQAVREISAVQRRMDNVAAYVSPEGWVGPEPP